MYRAWLLLPSGRPSSGVQAIIRDLGQQEIVLRERPPASLEIDDRRILLLCTDPAALLKLCKPGLRMFSTAPITSLRRANGAEFVWRGARYRISYEGFDAHKKDDPNLYRMLLIERIGPRILGDETPEEATIEPMSEEYIEGSAGQLFIAPALYDLSEAQVQHLLGHDADILPDGELFILPPTRMADRDSYFDPRYLEVREFISRTIGFPELIPGETNFEDVSRAWPLAIFINRLMDHVLLRSFQVDGGSVRLRYRDGSDTSIIPRFCGEGPINRHRQRMLGLIPDDSPRNDLEKRIGEALLMDMLSIIPRRSRPEINCPRTDWVLSVKNPGSSGPDPGIWKYLSRLSERLRAPLSAKQLFDEEVLWKSQSADGFNPHLAQELFISRFWAQPNKEMRASSGWRYAADILVGSDFSQDSNRYLENRQGICPSPHFGRDPLEIECDGTIGEEEILQLRLLLPMNAVIRQMTKPYLGLNSLLGNTMRL